MYGKGEHKIQTICFFYFFAGPFSPCFEFVDPQDTYDACVMDVCVSHQPDMSCSAMKMYAQLCRQMQGTPRDFVPEAPHCQGLASKLLSYV